MTDAGAPRVAGYRVVRALGRGAMGAVFLVEPEGLPGALRAMKVLPAQDGQARARFLREAALLARVEGHPSLARVHAAGEAEGRPWVVVEFVDGEDLAVRLQRSGRLPWREAVTIAEQVARALHHVHGHGVLHRDVKPSNIVVDRDARAVLVDFGVAQALDLDRLTRTGVVLGTPAYLSPEQAKGLPLDARSDVHGLGAALFELLTGELPFPEGRSAADAIANVISCAAPPPSRLAPDVPPEVDRVVLRALAKEREARHADAAELAAELRACLDGTAALAGGRPVLRGVLAGGGIGGAMVLLLLAASPGPAPVAAPVVGPATAERPVAPGAAAASELDRLLARRDGLGALGWLKRRRRELDADALVRADAAARGLAVEAGRADDPVALTTALQVVSRLRDPEDAGRAGLPPGGEVIDAALGWVGATCDAAARAAVRRRPAAPEGLAASTVDPLEALAGAGLRGGDRDASERVIDAAFEAFKAGAFPVDAYVRALRVFVALDLDLQSDHLRGLTPPQGGRGWVDDYLRLRAQLYEAGVRVDVGLRARAQAGLAALLDARGPQLGPTTRSRLTAISVPSLRSRAEHAAWIERLRAARRDDPTSPFAAIQLAVLIGQDGAAAEAIALSDEALALLHAPRYAGRETTRVEHALLYRSAARVRVEAGDVDGARATVAKLRALGAPEAYVAECEEEVTRLAAGRR